MRIAIVNDVAAITYTLEKILKQYSDLELAWTARDGAEAIEKCKNDTPDIILMDMIMPNVNGVQATRAIMQDSPCAILIVTSSVTQNASMVFEAMGAGALDAVNTPDLTSDNINEVIDILHRKIVTIGRLIGKAEKRKTSPDSKPAIQPHASHAKYDFPLIAIGSSTGGPAALSKVLTALPRDINAAVIIIQHVDKTFAPGMADWLNSQTDFPVKVAQEGDVPTPGTALLAATNDHLIMNQRGVLTYTESPVESVYRPSVDAFYDSIYSHWKNYIVAALLTGMGKDGANGMLRLHQKGAYTIAQDKKSCAVFGMPKAAIELNAATIILPIDNIGQGIIDHLKSYDSQKHPQHGVK